MRKKYSRNFAIFSLAIFLLSQIAPLSIIHAEIIEEQDQIIQEAVQEDNSEQGIVEVLEDQSIIEEINQNIVNDEVYIETINPEAIEKVTETSSESETETNFIVTGQRYYSDDGQASIVFNTLPKGDFSVEIKNVETAHEVASKAVTPAYEFITTPELPAGSFTATITLPLVKSVDSDIQLAYSEDGENFVKDDSSLLVSSNSISFDVDHFTIFVVVNPNPAGNGNESNDDCATVTIGGSVTCYDTIQAAITAAVDGDTINIKNGTYTIGSTINVNKQLTISGESKSGVIIDMSGLSTYGWNVTASNVTIENMTVMGTAGVSSTSRTFKFGNPMPIISNGTLRNITVTNGNRTPFDIHGVDNFTGENLTATGTVSGVGLSLTGVNGANITGFAGGSNAWGDIAIFGSTYTIPNRGSSNITIINNPNIGFIYSQDVSPSLRNDIGTITVTGRTLVYPNPMDDTFYTYDYTAPVVDIDEAAVQMIAGEACGIGSAVSNDGLSINVSNWDNTYTIQGRYFVSGGGFTGWNNIMSWGTLTVTGTDANLFISNSGNSPAGPAGWEVRVIDSGNNVISNIDSVSYNIVTDPATFVCNGLPIHQSPANGAIVNSSSLILDWSDITSGNGGVTYTYQASLSNTTNVGDNSLTTPIYTSGPLASSQIDASGSTEATYYWQVRACDAMAICTNWTTPWQLTVDNTSPFLVFNNDVSATPTSNEVINVTATDLHLDSASLEYGFSSDAICDASDTYGNAFTNTVNFSITSSAHNGQYLCVKATDLAGNTGYATSSNVLNIDDTLPTIGTVSAVTTYASAYVRGDGVGFDIRMPASDANGIASCEYSLDGGTTWTAGTYNTVPAIDRCEGLDVNAADGTVLTITMRATDGAGNSAVGIPIVRTADSIAPSVTSFAITPVVSGFTSSNPTLNFTVTDTVSPINRCEYRYRVTGSGGAGWSAWTLASIVTPGVTASCSASITGLSDAVSYDFQVRGRDSVNRNSLAANLTYVVDATVPNTVFTSPTSNSNWNGPITISGNSTDANGIDYVTLQYSPAGGGTWTTIAVLDNTLNDSPYNWSNIWTPPVEGDYDLRALSTDTLGNTDSSAVVTNISYDISSPNITFDGFRNQSSVVYDSTPAINACGNINTSGFIAWEWTLNNFESDPVNYTYTITSGPTAVGYTTNTTNTYYNGGIPMQGTYTVEVYGTDSAGNVGNTVTCSVTYDATEPETVLNPPISSPTNDNTPTFTGIASDNLTNIVSVEYRYSGDGGSTWSGWIAALPNDTFDSNSEGFSFTTGALTDGTYIIQSRATDGAGFVESVTNDASQQTIIIDTTAPTPVTPEWGYNIPGAGYVTNSGAGLDRHVACGGFINTTDPYRGLWAASTDLSGIAGYERDVAYNGSYVGTFPASTNYTVTFTPFAGVGANGGEGNYAVRIRAIDNAGNASIDNATWANKTIDGTWCTMTIDVTDPVTVLNAPSLNPTNDNTPTFTGTVTENLTNIFKVEYRYSNDGGSTWSSWVSANANDGFFDTNAETFNFTTGILADGNYIFQVRGTDYAGNIESITNDASQQLLTIDTVAPVVTIDYLETRDRTPELTGTVDDPTAIISVTVNGNTYTATNNGDGTWTLVDGSIPTNLPNRYYDVVVTATDAATNVGTDATSLDLIVDRIQPVLTLTSLSGGEYIYGPFVVSGTLSDPALSDGNPGVGIMDLRVRFRRESDNALVATCWAVYNSMTNTFSLDVNDGGSCNVPDGEYLIRLRARDNLLNTRWLTINNVTIDNVIPTVSSLADATFNEGDTTPTLSITGTDTTRISELCVDINSSPLGSFGTVCLPDDGNVNTSYTWNLSDYISYGFVDTSIFPEGTYDISYYVKDMAGNSSTVENVIYTIVNVAPVVSFGSNQTINEGENATFTSSFTDPSSVDSGDMIYDDASWSATVDYGDGSTIVNLGDFAMPGSISIPNHTYVNNGTYTVTLEVCEEDPMVNTESEGECTTETVTVTVNNVVPSVTINASPSTSVLTGTNVTLAADVSANVLPGNQIVSYSWSGDCSGTSSSFVLATPTARAYNCTVLVTDVDGDTATANITISASNGIPSVVIIANPGVNVTTGTVVTLIGNILGGDANFSYVWSGACSGSGTNAGGLTNTTTVPSTPGSYYCRIDITDANGDTAASGVIVAVNNPSTGSGVGGTGEVLGANTNEDTQEEVVNVDEETEEKKSGNVLGALVCETKQTMSGKVQNKDNGEGIENVTVTISYNENGRKIKVAKISTDENGEWEVEVCPGTYNVEIDETTLPSGAKLDDSTSKVLSITVGEDNERDGVNFNVLFEAGFNWLVIIIPLIILLILFIMFILSRRRDEE